MTSHFMRERRHRRSTEVTQALRYQLEACREAGALEAVLIADDSGLCMAFAGPREVCDEVAAELPILAARGDGWEWTARLASAPVVVVRSLVVDAARMFVCGVGTRAQLAIVPLARSLRGLERILHAG
jgi:hypothetical protein